MSRIAAIALFVLATVMTSSSASAQIIKVVPFDFNVNNSMPTGTDTFGFDSVIPRLVIIQSRMGSKLATDLGARVLIGTGTLRTLIFQDLPKQPPPPFQCASPRSGEQRRFKLYVEIAASVFLCVITSWAMLDRWTDTETRTHQALFASLASGRQV